MFSRSLVFLLLILQNVSYGQDFDAEVLLFERDISVNRGRLIKSSRYEILINNRSGERYTDVSIPFSSLKSVQNINAYIKDNEGEVVRRLRRGDITERSAISSVSFYDDNYVKEFSLRHNSYPYTIVYSYQETHREFFYIDHWSPVIDRRVPTRKAVLTLELPDGYSVSHSNRFVNLPVKEPTRNGKRYRWEADYREPLSNERMSPPFNSFLPSVVIVPIDFVFEAEGSFATWEDFGNWQHKLVDGASGLPDAEINRILSLTEGIEDDKEKIRILYHRLQNETRYINVSVETGGLKPYPASYVAEKKYGDCKALSNYFKSVLDVAGIESYYTLVHAGSPVRKTDKSFPFQQFNHVILYIPLTGDTLWVDCTSKGPFNYPGTFNQNRDALVIDRNNSRFVSTPAMTKEEVAEKRMFRISYNLDRSSTVSLNGKYKGAMFELLLSLEQTYGESDRTRFIRNNILESGFNIESYSLNRPDRDSTDIELKYSANTRSIYNHHGNLILVNNLPFNLPRLESPENRKLPVQIDYPVYRIDTLIYDIPRGYNIRSDFQNHRVVTDFGEYSLQFREKEGSMQVVKSMLIHSGSYDLEEYEGFYGFIKEIEESENATNIILIKN